MIEDKSVTTGETDAAKDNAADRAANGAANGAVDNAVDKTVDKTGDDAGDRAEGQGDDERGKEESPRPTYLFLIRHGENEWTERGALAGRTPSVPLNEKGKEQAQQIAERLKAQPITAVYSSPLLRCLETAQPLASALDQSTPSSLATARRASSAAEAGSV